MNSYKFNINSPEEMMSFADKIVPLLPNGTVICLTGDLGAGKTTFVRGLAHALHINEVVQSPTFNIMKLYLNGDKPLIHIDAYRLVDTNTDIGLDEYIGEERGITAIEWPMYIESLIPDDHIEISITNLGDNNREIVIISKSRELIEEIKECIH